MYFELKLNLYNETKKEIDTTNNKVYITKHKRCNKQPFNSMLIDTNNNTSNSNIQL